MQFEPQDVVWWLKAVAAGTLAIVWLLFPFYVLHRLKRIQHTLEEIRDQQGDAETRRTLAEYRRRASEPSAKP